MTGASVTYRSTLRMPGVIGVALLLFICTGVPVAHAFWPFGSRGVSGSGLDLLQGYDVNTVTTIKGKMLSVTNEEGGPFLIEIRSNSGEVYLVAGPWWYWKESGIPIHQGDELTARGSLSEGKDGRRYLLAQKVSNQRTGDEVVLRGDDGVPVWTYLKQSPGPNRPTDITPGPKPGGRVGSGPRGRR